MRLVEYKPYENISFIFGPKTQGPHLDRLWTTPIFYRQKSQKLIFDHDALILSTWNVVTVSRI